MRSRRRAPAGAGGRVRGVPPRSRTTRRRGRSAGGAASEPPPQRTTRLAAALRSTREALCDLQGQLDALLAALRDPSSVPDAGAAERLHGAARQAGSAVASLSQR